MCKIMIAPGIKNAENAWKFAKAIAPKLSSGNNDGFGYAAIDAKGKIFAERWLINDNAFKEFGLTDGDKALLGTIGAKMFKEKLNEEYSAFGDKKPDSIVSLMLHARAATGEKGLKNTHPFITKGTALIHNGVIRNEEELTKTMSTCDSETILHEYLNNEVNIDAEEIHEVIKALRGYFAVGVLTKDGKGRPIVDIFKSPTANLHVTYVDELGTVVFCTNKWDLERVIDELKWTKNKILEFGNNQFIRFDAITGEKLASSDIKADESYTKSTVSNYRNDDTDRSEFENIVDKFQKDVDWIKMIEEEETLRLAQASMTM